MLGLPRGGYYSRWRLGLPRRPERSSRQPVRHEACWNARSLGVEAERCALYRSISQDYPADNVTLEVAQFTCANDIQRVLAPYLTGKGDVVR